jgi:hypothetical protein
MLQAEMTELYVREINKLIKEIGQYETDAELWKTKEGINNSGGCLCQHLTGSLLHFIGATLGNIGYIRNRDNEFINSDKSRAELISGLENAREVITHTFATLSAETLDKEFAFDFAGKQSTRFYLLMFLGHLAYHLGQINYHRRLI